MQIFVISKCLSVQSQINLIACGKRYMEGGLGEFFVIGIGSSSNEKLFEIETRHNLLDFYSEAAVEKFISKVFFCNDNDFAPLKTMVSQLAGQLDELPTVLFDISASPSDSLPKFRSQLEVIDFGFSIEIHQEPIFISKS